MNPGGLIDRTTGIVLAISLGAVVGAASVVEFYLPLLLMLGLGAALVGIRYPALLLVVSFAGIFLDVSGLSGARVLGLPLTISKMGVAGTMVCWIIHAAVYGKQIFRWTALTAPMGIFTASMLISITVALFPATGWPSIASFMMLSVFVHLIVVVVEPDQMKMVMRAMGVITAGFMVYSLTSATGNVVVTTLDSAWQERAAGAFGDANEWATCVLIIAPLFIAAAIEDDHWVSKLSLPILTAALPLCVITSMSRAGFLALVAVAPGVVWMLRKRPLMIVGGIVAAIIILPMYVDIGATIFRYQTLLDPDLEADLGHGSLSERQALLSAGIKMFTENWFTGVGAGQFKIHASYVSAGAVWKVAHNTYLSVAAEQGIHGILALLYLMATIGICMIQIVFNASSSYVRSLGVGWALCLLAFGITALTLNLLEFAMIYVTIGLGMSLLRADDAYVASQEMDSETTRHEPGRTAQIGSRVPVSA